MREWMLFCIKNKFLINIYRKRGKKMPERGRDYHERDAHFDGEYEGIINDGLAREGEAMGVRVDIDPFEVSQRKIPFQAQPEVDPEMKRFRSLMKGKETK
jgi:hypothetical protein